MDPEDKQKAAQRDQLLRELERKSLDTFMVYNPTDTDYLLEWDKRYFRIPNKNKDMGFGKGKMELYRYLTEKYAREMKNKLITEENDASLQELKDKMTNAGVQDVTLNANLEFERNRERRTDNEALIKKYYDTLILGLVREYGLDELPEAMQPKRVDPMKTVDDVAFESVNKRYESDIRPEVTIVSTSTDEKVTLEEVTA